MKPRIVYIHGNGASHWSFGWAKWFKEELEKRGYETFFETMPDSVIARKKFWFPFLENHIKAGEGDVLVGWSSGAIAAMRYAETHKIKGSVLIGPSSSDLGDELEKQSGYFDTPWQWQKIKENQEHVAMVYSDDDPFIPQEQFAIVEEELHPDEVLKFSGRGHFIDEATFPELLDYILRTYP